MPKSHSGKKTAFQILQEQLKWVDLVIEVRDARLPESSAHPKAESLFAAKPRLLVLAKADLSDKTSLSLFTDKQKASPAALPLSLKQAGGKDKLIKLALAKTEVKRQALARKGLLPRPMRACVVGMPNVGKSSLINWLIGQKKAKVGNQPGITKGTQWIRIHPQLELLDTPGILPSFSLNKITFLKLALLNLLPENQYDYLDIAEEGLHFLSDQFPDKLAVYASEMPISLEKIAHAKNFLASGGRLDVNRAARLFLNDLREGKLGKLNLDAP